MKRNRTDMELVVMLAIVATCIAFVAVVTLITLILDEVVLGLSCAALM